MITQGLQYLWVKRWVGWSSFMRAYRKDMYKVAIEIYKNAESIGFARQAKEHR